MRRQQQSPRGNLARPAQHTHIRTACLLQRSIGNCRTRCEPDRVFHVEVNYTITEPDRYLFRCQEV